jgi:hypothetical protein
VEELDSPDLVDGGGGVEKCDEDGVLVVDEINREIKINALLDALEEDLT